jgi:hypothetical protein
MRRSLLLSALVLLVFLLHQDCWNWARTEPRLLGFLPVGLAFHAAYCLLASALMAVLVKFAWPRELDELEPPRNKSCGEEAT